ncbi:MAG: hypothetical protein ABIV06_05560 [Thermoanaerobaculia bacterium]
MRSSFAKRSVLVLSALSTVVVPTLVRAQGGLQVADAANVVLGPVVGFQVGNNAHIPTYYFAYHQAGNTVLLSLESATRISHYANVALPFYFYYEIFDCLGTPVMATGGDCCVPRITPKIIPGGIGQLWAIDETHTINPTVASRRPVGYSDSTPFNCENFAPVATQGFEISQWGTLNFTPPLRIEGNPFIFGDDFSSQNMGAWSNY